MNADVRDIERVAQASAPLLSEHEREFASNFDCIAELEAIRTFERKISQSPNDITDIDYELREITENILEMKQKAMSDAFPFVLQNLRSTAAKVIEHPELSKHSHNVIGNYMEALLGPFMDTHDLNSHQARLFCKQYQIL
jgi:uncharacterized protein (DUF1778 family)